MSIHSLFGTPFSLSRFILFRCLVYVTGLIFFASESFVLRPHDSDIDITTIAPSVQSFEIHSVDVSQNKNLLSQDDSPLPLRHLSSPVNQGYREESFFVTTAKTLPVFVFMFSCAQNLLSITNELKVSSIIYNYFYCYSLKSL